MKILITGAGGMLGTDLVSRLSSKHSLCGVGRRPAPHLRIPYQIGNLANFHFCAQLIQAEQPEIILQAAAMTDVDACETNRRLALQSNFDAARNIVEAANRVGTLVIFFSTDFVFDGDKTSPYAERDIPHPINVYGETKFLAERYFFLRGKRFLILRTSWLFGGNGNNFPKKILEQAKAAKPFQVISDQFGSPTFTGDLAEAVGLLMDALPRVGRECENQIYHMANEGIVSRFEFAQAILRNKNYPVELIRPVSNEVFRRPAARPKNSALSCEKLKNRFGIQLGHWEEGLRAYFSEQENPVLRSDPV